MLFLYSVGMSGAHNPIYTNLIQPFLPFKCSGHGCACDLAGKEMENCLCFEPKAEQQDSCCSKKTDSPPKTGPQIKEVGCDGSDLSNLEFLDRHIPSSFHLVSKFHFSKQRPYPPSSDFYFFHLALKKDKIPIS